MCSIRARSAPALAAAGDGRGTLSGPPRGSFSTSGRVTTVPKRGRSGRRVSAKTQSSSPRATQAVSSASSVPQSEGNARLAAAETKPAAKVSTGRRFLTRPPYFSRKLAP